MDENRRGLPPADQPQHAGATERAEARKRFIRRRRKMLTLVEELSLRTRRVQPMMRQMERSPSAWTDIRQRLAGIDDRQPGREGRAGQPPPGAPRPDAHHARKARGACATAAS